MQTPPKEGAWIALFSNLSKSGLDNYIIKRSKRPLLDKVAWPRLPCPICLNPNQFLEKVESKSNIWPLTHFDNRTVILFYFLFLLGKKERVLLTKDANILVTSSLLIHFLLNNVRSQCYQRVFYWMGLLVTSPVISPFFKLKVEFFLP